jgi:hypothetical protein
VDRRARDAIRARQDDLKDRLNEFGPGQPDDKAGAAKGRPRRPQRPQGNSRACILRRLRRDYPQLHALVLDGTLSPHRAAIQAGFRRPPGKRPKRRPFDEFDITPTQEMELWLGAPAAGSSFTSEEERHRLWLEHRDRLLGYWGQNGRRPQAWWQYDSPIPYPGYDHERSTLYTANLLAEDERAELLKFWREQFERRLLDPNVSVDACEAHIEWCDIPRPLLAQWANEYLRKKAEPQAEAAVQGSDQSA